MSLIKSISGIRGTIGSTPGDNLTPSDILKFVQAYGAFIKQVYPDIRIKIVIGRDARISGAMIRDVAVGTLNGLGIDVIDLGLASTPTVEMAVVRHGAQGGIIITASHNPQGWNALKLLDSRGEFLSKADGEKVLVLAETGSFLAATEDQLGNCIYDQESIDKHLQEVLRQGLVDAELIRGKKYRIVVDGINSVGGVIVPKLLQALGVADIISLNCEPNGVFAHRPEPLDENLGGIKERVRAEKADLGIVVDPDVDRLAFIDENGEMFGEEYTLVAVADYIFGNFAAIDASQPGKYRKAAVSNLSSSRALRDIAEKHGGSYEAAAVGEVNVVTKTREINAVIGGEGNGGVIFPEVHCGRDAMVGIALFLTYLAKEGKKMSELRRTLPEYSMVKDKIALTPEIDLKGLLGKIKEEYRSETITDIDGVKIDWPDSWVHLRGSNTEPIIRIYAESRTLREAEVRVKEIKDKIFAYIK